MNGYYASHVENGICKTPSFPALDNGYALAIYSDCVCCDTVASVAASDMSKLLEVRAFNEEWEYHAIRSSLDAPFVWRCIYDDASDDGFSEMTLDDFHYLDIDVKQSNPDICEYRTTGGGFYRLPVANAQRIHLRNYLEYDDDGLLHVIDFRIVGFSKEEVDDGER